ncbi:ABC transporter ATP-binding protein [Thermoproteota archaeon]
MSSYLRILRYIKPYFLGMFLSLLLALLYAAANILFLPLIRDLTTEVANKNLVYFNNQVLNALGLMLIRLVSQHAQVYIMSWISYSLIIDIRLDIFQKLLNLTSDFFSEWRLGDILTRMFSDVEKVREAIIITFSEIFPQTVTSIGILAYAIYLNWKLTLLAMLAVPLIIMVLIRAGGKMKKSARHVQRKTASLTHITQEAVTNIKLVQAYTMEEHEFKRVERESKRSFRATMKGVLVSETLRPLVTFIQYAAILFVVWYGGYEIVQGTLTGPELMSFFVGIALLVDPVIALSKVYTHIQQSISSAERLEEILDVSVSIKNIPDAKIDFPISGKVEFVDVSFRYKDDERMVLSHINLSVEPGEIVALVGVSGVGKSTLVNLLPRFYDPTEGRIEMDGTDLKALDLKSYRRQISIVPQEDIIFRGTVFDNIRYGTPEATRDDVIAASKLANAWEFIEGMPRGLMTKVGDRGCTLSGGQRQRISIARAILRNPKILILDEATSALDSESEQLVQDALQKLMKNRTTFVIAHRLSTVVHAHKLVILEDGHIQEIGRHEELLNKSTLYAKLYHLQFEKKVPVL